jgi:hypothetical protein
MALLSASSRPSFCSSCVTCRRAKRDHGEKKRSRKEKEIHIKSKKAINSSPSFCSSCVTCQRAKIEMMTSEIEDKKNTEDKCCKSLRQLRDLSECKKG